MPTRRLLALMMISLQGWLRPLSMAMHAWRLCQRQLRRTHRLGGGAPGALAPAPAVQERRGGNRCADGGGWGGCYTCGLGHARASTEEELIAHA